MLGGGGSVLAVPVLVYILGQSVHQATTASLVVVTAGAVRRPQPRTRRRVCWRHAIAFIAAALPGVIAGTALGQARQRPRTNQRPSRSSCSPPQPRHGARPSATQSSPRTELSRTSCPPSSSPGPDGRLAGRRNDRLLRRRRRLPVVPTWPSRSPSRCAWPSAPRWSSSPPPPSWPSVPISRLATRSTSASPSDDGLGDRRRAAGVRLAGHVPQRQLGQGFAALVVVAAYLLVSAAFLGSPT